MDGVQTMKPLIIFVAGVFISGCISDPVGDTTGVITATPKPFAYPGMYSGSSMNGIVTYKIQADGRGVSCFRNKFSGKLFLGDIKYDGAYLYTEDGTLTVDSVNENEMKTHASHVNIVLHRMNEAPSICREFFNK
jgi:hypothetical protein